MIFVMRNVLIYFAVLFVLSSCTVVRQGEVGVKRKLGKLGENTVGPGAVGFNPLTTRVIKMPIRTMNIEITSNLPSKEGLNVGAAISILYRIKPDMAPEILEGIGPNYENVIIKSVFRSASADVCSRFYAKDMHTAQRATIEREITKQMSDLIGDRGFEIEAVLLKTIQLPPGLARAVEEKLEAEQDAQRMEFLLQRERLEAQRKLVEAEGTRDAQQVLAEGLSEEILQWQTIEAFKDLSTSPNSKVIITGSNSPLLMNEVTGN